jgi:hypothetical protein
MVAAASRPGARPAERGILGRCLDTRTCPKIVEHFGATEVWSLKMTPEWVGTDGKADLPLPDFVRRYYIASTAHGGGSDSFDANLPGVGLPPGGPACPGNNFGDAMLPPNPVPHTETVNAIRWHFRRWVMHGAPPPASRWPTLDPSPAGHLLHPIRRDPARHACPADSVARGGLVGSCHRPCRFRARWDAVQIAFVDDPAKAVRDADELVAQVMKSLADSFAGERARFEGETQQAGTAATESHRVALRRYRSFFQRLLSL